jgi:hypothetical protein
MSNKEFPITKLCTELNIVMIQNEQISERSLTWTLEIPCWILDIYNTP